MGMFDKVLDKASKTFEDPITNLLTGGSFATLPLANQLRKGKNPLVADTSSQDDAAESALKQMQDAYSNIQTPDLSVSAPSQYSDLGSYAPSLMGSPKDINYELASAPSVGNTEFGNISIDPRLRDAQMGSLDSLDAIIKGGGMTDADKANLSKIQSDNAQADRGRREAILQNLGARGMSGSGNELLAQLQSSQAATDRTAQQDLGVAGQAQQRALDSIMNRGNMAGNISAQDYGQQAQKAAAADTINKFNASNLISNNQAQAAGNYNAAAGNRSAQQATQQFNANSANDAAKYGKTNAQNVANQNTSSFNDYLQHKDALPQQNFANQNTVAAGKAGVAQPAVNYYTQQGDRATQERANLISSLLQGGALAAKAAG